jgi:tetratricopeptide (TPR) repeat protein
VVARTKQHMISESQSSREPSSESGGSSDSPWFSRQRRLLVLVGILVCLVMGWVYVRILHPPPPVPVPADLAKLEPQLRSYLEERVQWVKASPRDANRFSTLGLAYAANGLWLEARLAFTVSVQLRPSDPLPQMYVAVAAQEAGNVDEAISLLRQLAVRFPDFPQGHSRLGDLLARAGVDAEAAPVFERLIQLAPGEWRGYAGLGGIKLRAGNAEDALRLLQKAVELDPSAKPAHHSLGLTYQRLGRQREAERHLRLGANALHYPMPDPWSNEAPQHMRRFQDVIDMCNDLVEAGQPDRAIPLLESLYPFYETNVTVLNNLGIAYNQNQQPIKAKPILERGLRLNDRHLPSYITYSVTCLALGQNADALKAVNRALELATNNPHSYLARANVLLVMEKDEEALASLEQAAKLLPQDARIRMDIGDILWRNLAREDAALARYLEASKLDPTLAPVFIRLADLRMSRKEFAEAKEALATARQLAPDLPDLPVLERRLLGTNSPTSNVRP